MIHPGAPPAPSCQGKSRWLFGTGLIVLAGLLFWTMALLGAARTWDLLGVPYLMPGFADARGITAGAESAARGFDPLVDNRADPYGQRPLNYPRIWRLLFHLGLSQRDTALLAGVFIGFFLLGLILIMRDASGLAVLIQLVCLASPAVGLCLERGNNDLLVFFVVALAVLALEYRPWLSAALIGFAFLLKLYPLAALAVFCGPERKNRWLLIGTVGLGAAAYLFLERGEIHTILIGVPVGVAWSYSDTFLIRYLLQANGQDSSLAQIVALMAAAALVGAAGWAARREPAAGSRSCLQLAAFRAGAAIYALTFCSHPCFSYRLIFILLVIPQLVEWVQEPLRKKSFIAGITLLAAIIGLWAIRLPAIWMSLPGGLRFGWWLAQYNFWILLAGLAYLGINTALDPRPDRAETATTTSV